MTSQLNLCQFFCKAFNDRYEFALKIVKKAKLVNFTSEYFSSSGHEFKTGLKIHAEYSLHEKHDFSVLFVGVLDSEKCELSFSSGEGQITGVLIKDEKNVGRYLLPLRLIDECELNASINTREIVNHLRSNNIQDLMFQLVADQEREFISMLTGLVDDSFVCLRETI